MSQEVTTTVKVEKVLGPFAGQYGEFMKFVWETEDGQFSKILKATEEAPGLSGKTVRILHTGGKYQNIIEYNEVKGKSSKNTVKKVTEQKNEEGGEEKQSLPVENNVQTVKTTSPDKDISSGNGARNEMITRNAVTLALARGETDAEGMQQAALDVRSLVDFVEKQS